MIAARLARAVLIMACLLGILAPRFASAHVGSPDTWFEGQAGPYPVRVVVRSPSVVPGLAVIDVRVLKGSPRAVSIQAFAWNAGAAGAPPPDIAKPVPGDPQLYTTNLWFMEASSYGVHVHVSGEQGEGVVIVPVQAIATGRLPMDRPLTVTLIALGVFLFAGFITLVAAGARESTLPPGAQPEASALRRSRIARIAAAIVLALALYGGRTWWDNVDRAYAADLYKPFHIVTNVVATGGVPVLRLAIDDERWHGRQWTPLITDHGKLMHLFLVRLPDLANMAHLHPVMVDSSHFETRLPPSPELPPGRYRVYADIVHESGFAQTLVSEVNVPATMPTVEYTMLDTDDSWSAGPVAEAADDAEVRRTLPDGCELVWERGKGPLVERREHPLRFRVVAPDGKPAALEPYMGMVAHAMVTRADGTVFAHLHPTGSASMAAQMALTMRTPADTLAGTLGKRIAAMDAQAGAMHGMAGMSGMGGMPGMSGMSGMSGALGSSGDSGAFAIPYGFPKAGRYRMWVQVKRGGKVETAAFDVDVAAAGVMAAR